MKGKFQCFQRSYMKLPYLIIMPDFSSRYVTTSLNSVMFIEHTMHGAAKNLISLEYLVLHMEESTFSLVMCVSFPSKAEL